jgi:26S proteasome regulatory subunit N1
MAQDSDLSKSLDKGKGKAVDNERKADETQSDKAGKPVANGKKDDDKAECLCSISAMS